LQVEKVDISTHKLTDGTDYYTINPCGAVPLLQLDNGESLTEGSAILQYIAALAPASGLAPAYGTVGYARVTQWLSFLSAELHSKAFGCMFNPKFTGEAAKEQLFAKLGYVEGVLAGRETLVEGAGYTIADYYLFVQLGWLKYFAIELKEKFPALAAFHERVSKLAAVAKTLEAESH
jgi:glutathione S-transferase